jgi:hypothetical protein
MENSILDPRYPEVSSIPESMRSLPQWVCWKLEEIEGRLTKVPYNPRTGRHAASNDPTTWDMLEQAQRACKTGGYFGIGFMFANGFAGIDLDQCRNPETGGIEQWACDVVKEIDSYTEISPSKEGLHIFVKGKLPGGGIKREWNGHKIEIYDTGRFFTVTGMHLEETPLDACERQAELVSLYNTVDEATRKRKESARKQHAGRRYSEVTSDDSMVMDLALNSKNGPKFATLWSGDTSGYASQSEADAALVSILCFYSQDDAQVERLWLDSGLYREKLERADYRQLTIGNARASQTDYYRPPKTHSPESVSEEEVDDPPISSDTRREEYLRRLWANHNRVNRAVMMMAAALGFQKLPWRLITAIHGLMYNRLGVVKITNEQLQAYYARSGESGSSERTIRRDKGKLWKAQKVAGIELFYYWHGRKNPETEENIASRYQSYLGRWALQAIDLAIECYGYRYSDDNMKEKCEEIASRIPRTGKRQEPRKKENDIVSRKLDSEKKLLNLAAQFKEIWAMEDLTTGEIEVERRRLMEAFIAETRSASEKRKAARVRAGDD